MFTSDITHVNAIPQNASIQFPIWSLQNVWKCVLLHTIRTTQQNITRHESFHTCLLCEMQWKWADIRTFAYSIIFPPLPKPKCGKIQNTFRKYRLNLYAAFFVVIFIYLRTSTFSTRHTNLFFFRYFSLLFFCIKRTRNSICFKINLP